VDVIVSEITRTFIGLGGEKHGTYSKTMYGWVFTAFVLLLAALMYVQYSRVEDFRRDGGGGGARPGGSGSGRSGSGSGGARLGGGVRHGGGGTRLSSSGRRPGGHYSGRHHPHYGGHRYYPRRDVVYVGGSGGWDWWPYPYDYWWSPLWFPSCALTGCPPDQDCVEDPVTGYSYCV
jgi:hypothetical protein